MKRIITSSLARAFWARILMLAASLAMAAAPAHAQEAPASAPADSQAIASPTDSSEVANATASAPSDSTATGLPAATANGMKVIRMVRLVNPTSNVVRSGPGDGYAIVGVYPKGAAFPVIAKNGPWYGVRLSETESGWIHASLCKEFDDLSDLEFKPNPKTYSRTGSYTLGAYGGAYAFDRKSNTLVLGGRLGYYVFDRIRVEAGLGWTHVRRPAEIVESLFGLSLEAEDFHMLFYHLNAVWEVLPGRQMVPFAEVGVGTAIMRGETEPTFHYGAGTTLFLSKRTAMRWEFRDYRFDTGPKDARVSNDNIEFTLGTEYLF